MCLHVCACACVPRVWLFVGVFESIRVCAWCGNVFAGLCDNWLLAGLRHTLCSACLRVCCLQAASVPPHLLETVFSGLVSAVRDDCIQEIAVLLADLRELCGVGRGAGSRRTE